MKVLATILAVIGTVIAVIALSWGIWLFGVWASDIVGRGEAVKTKNNSTNRIAAQERFEDLSADISIAQQRIDTLAAQAKTNKSYAAQTAATGAVTYCLDLVAQYNAEARKYTARDFREADLPSSYDPAITCRGN